MPTLAQVCLHTTIFWAANFVQNSLQLNSVGRSWAGINVENLNFDNIWSPEKHSQCEAGWLLLFGGVVEGRKIWDKGQIRRWGVRKRKLRRNSGCLGAQVPLAFSRQVEAGGGTSLGITSGAPHWTVIVAKRLRKTNHCFMCCPLNLWQHSGEKRRKIQTLQENWRQPIRKKVTYPWKVITRN